MRLLYILGRQPAIGLAELESLYGDSHVAKIGKEGALVTTDTPAPFLRLGGAIKQAIVKDTVSSSDWRTIEHSIQGHLNKHLESADYTKLTLGLSVYGENTPPKKLLALGLTLKKTIKKRGLSARLVPNQESSLNSAQVYHNKLTGEKGLEVIIYRDSHQTYIAFTQHVQDIDSYTFRDRGRPKRDSRVGMLPPKLAQTIINLSTADTSADKKGIVLDPFCGTGVILQEASLMGFHVYGTDIEKRMIDYTDSNLEWLKEKLTPKTDDFRTEVGDATSHTWKNSHNIKFIASEAYLGRPFTTEPDKEILFKNRNDCDTIIRKFLENIHSQIQSDTRLCLGVPAWFAHGTTYHLKTLDYLEEIGYNRISFVHSRDQDLIYHREDQVVGRELVVMRRK